MPSRTVVAIALLSSAAAVGVVGWWMWDLWGPMVGGVLVAVALLDAALSFWFFRSSMGGDR